MSKYFSEMRRELKRNMKTITGICFETPSYDDYELGPPNLLMPFSPLLYLGGVLLPVVETPARKALGKYPFV